MAIQRAILAVLLLFISSTSFADGQLSIAFQNQEGFNKILIKEMGGVRQGSWVGGGGNTPLAAFIDGDQFRMHIGSMQDFLYLRSTGTHTNFLGKMWSMNKYSNLDSYVNEKGEVRIMGMIAEQVKVDVYTNPTKGTFYMYWNNDYMVELYKTPAKGAGSCKGRMKAGLNEVGTFTCQSMGALQDTLFTNPYDIIAWMVHIFVLPNDDDSEQK
ncbi:MAG: hypothetical protein AB7F59_07775 [Bdellovibrionales bacterium]